MRSTILLSGLLLCPEPALAQESALQADWYRNPATGHWYGLDYVGRPWEEAEARAVSHGGHLVTIRSQEEQDWIEQTFSPYLGDRTSQGIHIGLHQDLLSPDFTEPGGSWVWSSGAPLSFTNWLGGEPNNANDVEHWGHIRGWSSTPWGWNDTIATQPSVGLFELPTKPETGWSWPRVVATGPRPFYGCLADLDGDGDLDYASVDASSSEVSLHWNTGSGDLIAGQVIPVPLEPRSALALDADLDGDLDLIVTSKDGGELRTLTQDNGSFAPGPLIDTGSCSGLATIDYNSDGVADLVTTASDGTGPDGIHVYPGLAGGGFGGRVEVDVLSGLKPWFCTVADVDGDSHEDLVVPYRNSGKVTVYFGDGQGGFPSVTELPSGPQPYRVSVADLDLDGDLDLVVPVLGLDVIQVWQNVGIRTFTKTHEYPSGDGPHYSEAADFNGDGLVDVVVPSFLSDDVRIFWGDGAGGLLPAELFGQHDYAHYAVAGDVNGDGTSDLLVARHNSSSLALWLNASSPDCNGNGTGDAIDIFNGVSTDCDSDGTPDECQIADDPSLDQNLNGLLDSCECVIEAYCIAAANSTGQPAAMGGSGTTSLNSNDLTLSVSSAPPFQFGLFFYGADETFTLFGDGALCVSGPLARVLPVIATDGTGSADFPLDLNANPFTAAPNIIAPFETWRFQFWYRDPLGGPSGFNLSDGLAVTFCP